MIPARLRQAGHAVDVGSPRLLAQAEALDLLIVAGWGAILAPSLFAAPRLGTWNIHPSNLPARRGPHPLRWALLQGDDEFAVTIHRMSARVDAGPVLYRAFRRAMPRDRYADVLGELLRLAADALPSLVSSPPEGESLGVLSRAEPRVPRVWRRLDPSTHGAIELARRVAALHDWGTAFDAGGRSIRVERAWVVAGRGSAPGSVLPAPSGELHVATVDGVLGAQVSGRVPQALRWLGPARVGRA